MILNCMIGFTNCYSCKGTFISGAKLILRKLNSLHNFMFHLYNFLDFNMIDFKLIQIP